MSRYHTFRDDDISVTTDIGLLMKTHALIRKYGKTHTVAVQMERLWENKEIWFFLMTAEGLVVGLHGWDHSDYSAVVSPVEEISQSLHYWKLHTGAYPEAPQIKKFFPPWNRVSADLQRACELCNLELDNRWKKDTGVYGFHSWEMLDPERFGKLEKALRE